MGTCTRVNSGRWRNRPCRNVLAAEQSRRHLRGITYGQSLVESLHCDPGRLARIEEYAFRAERRLPLFGPLPAAPIVAMDEEEGNDLDDDDLDFGDLDDEEDFGDDDFDEEEDEEDDDEEEEGEE